MKRVPAIILLLAVALSAVGDLRLYATDWDRWGPLGPRDAIPIFEAPGVDNPGLNNEDLLGKVTVMTFWASWCGPCAQEMPAIEAVAQSYDPKKVHVVGVNRDREGDIRQIVRSYREQKQLSFDMVLDQGAMGRAFRVSLIPHLVIVDENTQIRFVHQGRTSESTLREEIESLLAEG